MTSLEKSASTSNASDTAALKEAQRSATQLQKEFNAQQQHLQKNASKASESAAALKECKNENKNLVKQMASIQKDMKALEKSTSKSTSSSSEASAALKQAQKQNATLSKQIHTLTKEVATAQKSVEQAQDKADETNIQSSENAKGLQEKNASIIKQLTSDLKAAESNTLTTVEKATKAATSAATKAAAKSFLPEIKTLNKKAKDFEKNLIARNIELQKTKDESVLQGEVLKETEKEVKSLKAQLASSSNKQSNASMQQIKTLRKELADQIDSNTKANKTNATLSKNIQGKVFQFF